MEQKKNYTLPIVMMFLLFAMISFVTGLSNPLGVIVKNQFAVANWMSQLGNFANFIAYAVMGIPAGMMLKRIGYKKTALAAVAVGFVGVGIQYLSGVAGSFPVYLIGAFVSGFSMCMLNTVWCHLPMWQNAEVQRREWNMSSRALADSRWSVCWEMVRLRSKPCWSFRFF